MSKTRGVHRLVLTAQCSMLTTHGSPCSTKNLREGLRAKNCYWLMVTSLFSARVVLAALSPTRMVKLTVIVALVSTACPFW
jgi:hypothetical protein